MFRRARCCLVYLSLPANRVVETPFVGPAPIRSTAYPVYTWSQSLYIYLIHTINNISPGTQSIVHSSRLTAQHLQLISIRLLISIQLLLQQGLPLCRTKKKETKHKRTCTRIGGFYKEETPHPRAQSDGRFIRSLARPLACLDSSYSAVLHIPLPPTVNRSTFPKKEKGKKKSRKAK